MKKSFAVLMGAMLLASGSLFAKVSVTKYAIRIDEPLTVALIDAALADYQKTGGTGYSLELSKCNDDGLAMAVQKFTAAKRITIRKSPDLTSIEPLKSVKADYIDLKELPKVADVSPVGAVKGLQGLLIENVGFKNPGSAIWSSATTAGISISPAWRTSNSSAKWICAMSPNWI